MAKFLGILTTYEMRIIEEKFESSEVAFKASKKVKVVTKEFKKLPKKIKEEQKYSSSESNEEFAMFANNLNRAIRKYKGVLPFKCFKFGEVGHFAAKYPHKRSK